MRTRGLGLVLSATLFLALGASCAWASKGVVDVFGGSGTGDAQFANAYGTAVSTSTGDLYVVDQFDHRVERFDANGTFLGAFGWGVADGNAAAETCASNCQVGLQGTGDGQFDTPQGIAIDQSNGSVYVVDGNNNRIERFDASGTYVSQFGTAGSADGQLSGPQGIAVDPTDGSVYVADASNNRVEKFDASGTFVDTFGFGVTDGSNAFQTCTTSCQAGLAVPDDGGFSGPTRVAVDSNGKVYVLDTGNGRIERYTSGDAFDVVFDPADVFAPQEIAVGSNDHLYVAQWAQDFSEQHVVEIDGSGTLVDTHGVGSTASNSSGLAVSAGSQRIYLADGFNARVFILDDVTPSSVSIAPAANVASTSVSLSGSVTPNGPPNVGWHFEISTDDANWTATGADQNAGSGNSAVPVAQDVTSLVPNTTYFVRLVAARPFNPTVISSEVQFSTLAIAPEVTTDPANDLAPTHATMEGRLNAHNSLTTYYFEYGPTANYGTSVPTTQDASGGSTEGVIGVAIRLDNLHPGTTYHYRLVATNPVATVRGADQVFTTTTAPTSSARRGIPGTGFLPDERGWEQVSQPGKNGGDVVGDTARERAASAEAAGLPMAVTYMSLSGFADVHGTGITTEYMSVRTGRPGTTGWATHGITPAQDPGTLLRGFQGGDPLWEGSFSPDLTAGVFRAWSPLTDAPLVAPAENLYLRRDLRASGSGAYQLLSDCPACATPLPPFSDTGQLPRLAGASSDFTHVIFESSFALTPDATPGNVNLYESVNGVVRLAGILPDGACGTPPCPASSSIAGQGAGGMPGAVPRYTPHTISADGTRIFFTDNSGTGDNTGNLYMRLNGTTTVQINASEKTAPGPAAPATYSDASSDGSRVFFTTTAQLTDDDTNSTTDLYMWNANAPAGHRLTLLSSDGTSGKGGGVDGMIGASDDGHYVYFVAAGQFVAGQPTNQGVHGFYEWHDGTITYIGRMEATGSDLNSDLPGAWVLGPLNARVTPDGQHLLFSSHSGAGLTGYDQGQCTGLGCVELYVYSAATHTLQCASCNPTGAAATAHATINVVVGVGSANTSSHLNRAISNDGRHVFFSTAEALVPGDTNGRYDAYEYDTTTGTVHLLSSGTDPSDSYFIDASADGSDAFFMTRQQLVGWDNDQSYDLYDARVDGGLPDPVQQPPGCVGDTCQGDGGATPGASPAASETFSGAGNQVARPTVRKQTLSLRCKRGFARKKVKGKVRCIRKPAKRRTHKTATRSQHHTHGRSK